GTFDCSILTLSDGVFKVLATNGDTYLGGDDFDRAIMQHAARVMGLELGNDPELLQHLRDAAERAKIELTSASSAKIAISIPGRGISKQISISRNEFENLIAPFIDRSLEKCRSAMKDAGLRTQQIAEVALVGGSTRIPYVRQRVAEFFGR